ncbi:MULTISPECIES: lipid-A-disaccharide synthase [unclassified Moorena]|uniref:lipid-A-disaccharide synthase n=1 Tax=unclassified Moorena TaxID=2683338 RepID=UPI0025FE1BFE|nr:MULTISPECIES: lipid-A-disaccharide synthase [unclassified Moorena]
MSNGPGELTTWVRPVVKALRETLGNDRSLLRISVVLSPCPHATGKEDAIAKSYPEVDRVQAAQDFLPFLLWGKTAENWDWHPKGVVLFLGGDQFFPVVISKRLGYRSVVYAEWDARWYRWIDHFGVMKPDIIAQVPKTYAHKFTIVGDLMAEIRGLQVNKGLQVAGSQVNQELQVTQGLKVTGSQIASLTEDTLEHSTEVIALLPGSKPAKLAQGVPLSLAIAEHIHRARPQTRFVIPVAPTIDLKTLAKFANRDHNPIINKTGWSEAQLIRLLPEKGTADLGTGNREQELRPTDAAWSWGFSPGATASRTRSEQYFCKRSIYQQSPFNRDNLQPSNLQPSNLQPNNLQPSTLQPSTLGQKATLREQPPNLKPSTPQLFLQTPSGLCVELWESFPAYELLSQCCLCLTTVGANTAELGSLAVPMIVLLPTQQLDAMRAWDGLPGLLVKLPGVGSSLAKVINWLVLGQKRLFAWPNIWAKREIVPELVGKLEPLEVAQLALDYLEHPEKLSEMRSHLKSVRGKPGAAQTLAQLVKQELDKDFISGT